MHPAYLTPQSYQVEVLVDNTVSEMAKPGTIEQQICKFPVEQISQNPLAYRLLLACSLFAPSRIPLSQCLYTTDIREYEFQRVFQEMEKWGFLSQDRGEDGTVYLTMHSIYHSYLSERFQYESAKMQLVLNRRFLETWLDFLANNDDVHTLWGMSENLVTAIRMISHPDFDNDELANLQMLEKNHLLVLQMILPPKDRIRFLVRQKILETQPEKIAYIDEALAEGYIRLGRLIQAEEYAKLSLESFRELGDEIAIIQSLRRLGTVYRTQGRFSEAIESYSEAVTLCKNHKDQLPFANVKRQLGQTYFEMGDLDNAHMVLKEAQAKLESLLREKDTRTEIRTSRAYVLNTLGNVYFRFGNLRKALIHITEAKTFTLMKLVLIIFMSLTISGIWQKLNLRWAM